MSEEPLHFLPFEKWSELQKVFMKDLHRSLSAYTVLETQREIIERGFDYGFKVYCPYGDMENGMVAINTKAELKEIIIQCPQDDTKMLEKALMTTKLIDWDTFVIPFTPEHIFDCMYNLNISYKKWYGDMMIYEKPPVYQVTLPPNLKFGLLTPEHAEVVDTSWPHQYPSSLWYYQLLINMKRGYGLFEENNLIAWIFFNECGHLHHLFTIESARRKGYGELIVKLVGNILREEGKPLIAYCLNNEKSVKLFSKLGFEQRQRTAWFFKVDFIV